VFLLQFNSTMCPLITSKIECVSQFSSVQARDRPSGLRAFAEVLLEPSGRDVWLGTAGTLEAAKITSLSDE